MSGVYFSGSLLKLWIILGALLFVLATVVFQRRFNFIIGIFSSSVIVNLITTLIWPGWFNSYLSVDFSQALGREIGAGLIEYWPVATLFDFLQLIFGWRLNERENNLVLMFLLFLVISLGLSAFSSCRRKKLMIFH